MNVLLIFAITAIAFKLAYRFYGRHIDSVFDMSRENATPARAEEDARDYVPGKWQDVRDPSA